MSELRRHLGGRPSKVTQEFLAAANEVINQDDNALIYTDTELLFALNEKLSAEAQICTSTFEKWKVGNVDSFQPGSAWQKRRDGCYWVG
jgi:hypothetical protein